jgi:uncharacterized membrane protein (DUF4010 family)
MNQIELLTRFLTSLGIGLLLGLERERSPGAKAGLRTFALVALLGTLCALLAEKSATTWLLPTGMAALAAMMIVAHRQARAEDDPGTTSTVALMLCFGLGASTWYGYQQIAAVLALAVTGLLYFKAELHGITRGLSRQDWVSLFQFAVVTFVVLPVLPDEGMGPLQALNPYRVWLMVVLISGLSFAGYLVLRLAGERRGLPLLGVLGGLVSSTATTLAYSRHVAEDRTSVDSGVVIALIANVTVLAKLAVVAAVAGPQTLPQLLPILAGGLLAGMPLPFLLWRRLTRAASETPHLELSNPSEMRVALGFAALYAGVLLALAWLHHVAGLRGVYAMALASGLTDIDAITLSTLQLASAGSLSAIQAALAISLAYAASIALKFGIVLGFAGWPAARKAAAGYLCVLGGMGVGLLTVLG